MPITHFPRPFSFKRFFVFLLVLVLATLPDLQACGPFYVDIKYSIFDNYTLLEGKEQGFSPFLLKRNLFIAMENESSNQVEGRTQNLKEWQRYLNIKGLTIKDLDAFIYRTDFWYFNEVDNRKNKVIIASVAGLLKKNKKTAALAYINIAHACESLNRTTNETQIVNYHLGLSVNLNVNLPLKLEEGYKNAPDDFLKMRYAYQQVVTARYDKNYDACITFFEKRLLPFGKKNLLYWWGLDHYAASIAAKGNPAKANYLYAQVFANDTYKKMRMYEVFNPKLTTKSLSYCKNDDERAAILAIPALRNLGRGLSGLRQMQQMAPNSYLCKTLLTFEINKIEDWILTPTVTENQNLTTSFDESKKKDRLNPDYAFWRKNNLESDKKYAKTVLAWLETINAEKETTNTAFLQLATAYLAFITQDYEKSAFWAKLAEKNTKNTLRLRNYARLTHILSEIDVKKLEDPAVFDSNALLTDLKWLKKTQDALPQPIYDVYHATQKSHNTPYGDCMLALAARARAQNNPVYEMLFMAKGNAAFGEWTYQIVDETEIWFYELDRRNDAALVEKLINVAKAPKTPLERYLSAPINARINRVYDLLGTIYLRTGNNAAALAAYKKIPEKWWRNNKYKVYKCLDSDPFDVFMLATGKQKYGQNKATIVAKLIEYERKAATNDAIANFYVANFYENISFGGNAWAMTKYWHSGYDGYFRDDDDDYTRALPKNASKMEYYAVNSDFFSEKSVRFYKKAESIAKKQKNTKLLALFLYMQHREDERKEYEKERKSHYKYNGKDFNDLPSILALRKLYPQYATTLVPGDCTGWDAFLR